MVTRCREYQMYLTKLFLKLYYCKFCEWYTSLIAHSLATSFLSILRSASAEILKNGGTEASTLYFVPAKKDNHIKMLTDLFRRKVWNFVQFWLNNILSLNAVVTIECRQAK